MDLEFRVCRGASARKLLVHEAKSLGAATILAGTSKSPYIIRSSVSVAIYCARKLPKCVSVLAVDNGKVVFRREATNQGNAPSFLHLFFPVPNSSFVSKGSIVFSIQFCPRDISFKFRNGNMRG